MRAQAIGADRASRRIGALHEPMIGPDDVVLRDDSAKIGALVEQVQNRLKMDNVIGQISVVAEDEVEYLVLKVGRRTWQDGVTFGQRIVSDGPGHEQWPG